MRRSLAVFSLCCLVLATPLAGQGRVSTESREWLRALQLVGEPVVGSFTVTDPSLADSAGQREALRRGGPGSPLSAWSGVSWNSSVPYGPNAGPVWKGRGLTAWSGVEARFGSSWFEVTVAPVFHVSQNQDFELGVGPFTTPGSPLGYPWAPAIDLPQRPRDGARASVDPGHTSARFLLGSVSVGFGTEGRWWGPGWENGLILTDNTAGFPHFDVSSRRPISVGIGTVELQWIAGRSSDSGVGSVPNSSPFVAGLAAAFSPSFLEGLALGGTRFIHRVWGDGPGAGALLLPFSLDLTRSAAGEDPDTNQLVSLFLRWHLPGSGLEVYGEWGIEDYPFNLRHFFREPESSQAWFIGLRRALRLERGRILALSGELTRLERPNPASVTRLDLSWYTNGDIHQGHTHRGRVLGAWIGPGGNSQSLGADLFSPRGRLGLLLRRRTVDADVYHRSYAGQPDSAPHVALDLEFSGQRRIREQWSLRWGATLTRELNRYYQSGNDLTNVSLETAVQWFGR